MFHQLRCFSICLLGSQHFYQYHTHFLLTLMCRAWNDVTLFQSQPHDPKVADVLFCDKNSYYHCNKWSFVELILFLSQWEDIFLLKNHQVLTNTAPNVRGQTFTNFRALKTLKNSCLLFSLVLHYSFHTGSTTHSSFFFHQSHICLLYWK